MKNLICQLLTIDGQGCAWKMYNQFIFQSPGKARVKIERTLLTLHAVTNDFQNSLFLLIMRRKKWFE